MNHQAKNERRPRALVVDDHARARESVADVLRAAEYDVAACASASEALALLAERPFDVVITDLQMPGMNGLDFIRELGRRKHEVQALMITAHASVATAVEAMRLGAFDYIEKPFDAAALEMSVAQACERKWLFDVSSPSAARQPVRQPGRPQPGRPVTAEPTLIGDSPPMRELRERIVQVAQTEETVLIVGESGTGKELVARAIHANSRRAGGPLVSLNCPVLSAQLTESELFGHKRGAFTGAEADRVGRFELADGGSILLDEVTEIDLALQAKLLRVLQERTFERVGSSASTAVDVRVMATSNRDLPAEISAGRFRADLYYRLAVVPIVVPPLRERADDVRLLIDHFLDHAAERLGRGPLRMEEPARHLLTRYPWPGNVRELQNVVTRACVLSQDDTIRAEQIGPWLGGNSLESRQQAPGGRPAAAEAALPVGLSLGEMERRLIVATLERFGGHRGRAAAALGIGVRTLSGKLRDYGFAPREKDFAEAG